MPRSTRPRKRAAAAPSSSAPAPETPFGSVEPGARAFEEVAAHREAAVEQLAGDRVAVADTQQRHLLAGDDAQRTLGRLGRLGDRVDGRDLEREVGTTDAGELRGHHEQV